MKRLLTKAQAASRAGIDRATITRKTKEGQELFPALVGNKIDAGHPAFLEFLEKRHIDPTKADLDAPQHSESVAFPDDGSPQVMIDVQELRVREVGERFGGQVEFSGWLKTLKLGEEIREKRLKNDATDGSMIDRELVKTRVFGYLDEVQRRLLSDSVKTMTRQIYAAARAGVPIEQCEIEARATISRVLSPVKKRVAKTIRDAAPYGYEGRALEEESV